MGSPWNDRQSPHQALTGGFNSKTIYKQNTFSIATRCLHFTQSRVWSPKRQRREIPFKYIIPFDFFLGGDCCICQSQTYMGKEWRIECQKSCQNICQIECQIECQTRCQNVCEIECQTICQIEPSGWRWREMSDRKGCQIMSEYMSESVSMSGKMWLSNLMISRLVGPVDRVGLSQLWLWWLQAIRGILTAMAQMFSEFPILRCVRDLHYDIDYDELFSPYS